jgi:hypothetical protein
MQAQLKRTPHIQIVICIFIMIFSACEKPDDKPDQAVILRIAVQVPEKVYTNEPHFLLDARRTETLNERRPLSYLWTCTSFPAGGHLPRIENPAKALTKVDSFRVGQYRFQLIVTDNYGNKDASSYVVDVEKDSLIGKTPIAIAGADMLVYAPVQSVFLNGYGSWYVNPIGRILRYKWTLISKPAGNPEPHILDDINAITSVEGLLDGKYQFQLDVQNEYGLKASDTVELTVAPDPLKGTTMNFDNLKWLYWEDIDWGSSIYFTITDPVFNPNRYPVNMDVKVWDEIKSDWYSQEEISWNAGSGQLEINYYKLDSRMSGQKTKVQVTFK